jgi:hypothetical protein
MFFRWQKYTILRNGWSGSANYSGDDDVEGGNDEHHEMYSCKALGVHLFLIALHLEGNVFVQCDDNDFDDAIYFSDDNEIRVSLLA